MQKLKLRKENILLFIIIILAVSAIILPKPLSNLDELWNFNFARNVANGKLPYKDFNMLQTPLSAIICGMVLKIFGREVIVMRLLACFLCTFILFVSYMIMVNLKINKKISLICLAFLYYMYVDYFTIDYNFIILLIELILTYLELKNIENKDIKIDFLLGILAGTTLLFKQTSGLIVSLIFIFYKILNSNNKDNYRKVINEILVRLAGVLIPVIIGIIYFFITNTFNDFNYYAIKGVKTFSNNFIPYTKLINKNNLIITLISILMPLASIIMYGLTVIKEQKTIFQKKLFILFAYGFMELTIVFPIATKGYLVMGMIINFIAIIYILQELYMKLIHNKINSKPKLFIKAFLDEMIILFSIIIIISSFIGLGSFFKDCTKYNKLKHFKYIREDDGNITNILEFIEESNKNGQTVYILDASAAIYMIPLDKYNKDFDMFLLGNLGADGENGQIEKIKNMTDNEILLIKNEKYSRNWQNPEKVREYIINNWIKKGEIGSFDIYQKQ